MTDESQNLYGQGGPCPNCGEDVFPDPGDEATPYDRTQAGAPGEQTGRCAHCGERVMRTLEEGTPVGPWRSAG